MASLSKNGTELGRIARTWHTDAHFSSGKILRNSGFGWKVHATVRPGIDPATHFARREASYADLMARKPALNAFHNLVVKIPLDRRWKLKAALEVIGPEDSDGVWTSVNDYANKDKFDTIQKICVAYQAALTEAQAHKQAEEAHKENLANV